MTRISGTLHAVAALCAALVVAGCGGAGNGSSLEATPSPSPLAAVPLAAAPLDAPLRTMTGPVPPTSPSSTAGLEHTRRGSALAEPRLDRGYAIDPSSRAAVSLFYKTVFASSEDVASEWNGNLLTCDAGTTSSEFKAAVLRRVNWFRAMAGVPAAVQFDPVFNQKAQQAALMMAANNQLNHVPPASWLCYSAAGAEAAGNSDLTLGLSGPQGIAEGFMRDGGSNNAGVGHRRWLLFPQTQVMGTGDVSGAKRTNVLWVFDANIAGARPAVRDEFVAWPPKGYVPYQTVYPRWSFSYPLADFSAATVTMTENGLPIETRKEVLLGGYGENSLVWYPGTFADGMVWPAPAADTAYVVTVGNVMIGGLPRSFTYTTTVFDPSVLAAGEAAPVVSGSGAANVSQPAAYSLTPVTGANDYQWRSIVTTAFPFSNGAEAGTTGFTISASAGYSVVTSDASATGASSFHLAHTQAVDQTMLIDRTLVPAAGASLQFDSRLGLASTLQQALVELSLDDGRTWSILWKQDGLQSGQTSDFGETAFSHKIISLAPWAGTPIRLRFRYAVRPGGYYPQSSLGIGWYIDNIALADVWALESAGAPVDVAAPSLILTASQPGTIGLQARAGMYGSYAGWGPAKSVTVSVAPTPADCLFNWAQSNFAPFFTPAAASQTLGPYYFRYFSGSNSYLGISSADDHVYYLSAAGLADVGPKAGWFATAGCQ